jgi:hypothetical protein
LRPEIAILSGWPWTAATGPHIAYVVNGKWKYAYFDGSTWIVEAVGLPSNALRADIVIAPDMITRT